MHVQAIRTHRISWGESLNDILDVYVTSLEERSVLAITSKLVSVCQNRRVSPSDTNKKQLIQQEADAILDITSPYPLTIKHNRLIPSAGIDESNADGHYILYPENIQTTLVNAWQHLRMHHKVKELGVIMTDSSTLPLRQGVVGIGLGWCGFEPLYNYVGQPDMDGRPLAVTSINLLDAIAATAVWCMGEGAEQTPLAIIQSPPFVSFLNRPPFPEEEDQVCINAKDDLYAPLLKNFKYT